MAFLTPQAPAYRAWALLGRKSYTWACTVAQKRRSVGGWGFGEQGENGSWTCLIQP